MFAVPGLCSRRFRQLKPVWCCEARLRTRGLFLVNASSKNVSRTRKSSAVSRKALDIVVSSAKDQMLSWFVFPSALTLDPKSMWFLETNSHEYYQGLPSTSNKVWLQRCAFYMLHPVNSATRSFEIVSAKPEDVVEPTGLADAQKVEFLCLLKLIVLLTASTLLVSSPMRVRKNRSSGEDRVQYLVHGLDLDCLLVCKYCSLI